jgi:hypothetical protein
VLPIPFLMPGKNNRKPSVISGNLLEIVEDILPSSGMERFHAAKSLYSRKRNGWGRRDVILDTTVYLAMGCICSHFRITSETGWVPRILFATCVVHKLFHFNLCAYF